MKLIQILIKVAILAFTLGFGAALAATDSARSLLDYNARLLGSERIVNLKEAFEGKVILVVNTASRCAFTDQYEGLEALYADYRDDGLVVLGFPSNDFGNQEPGSELQIKDFCRLTYGVRFPMFAKTSVRKGTSDPLFVALGETAGRYPKWNFHKYLIGRDGRLVDDFLSITPPQSDRLVGAIEALL